MTERHGMLTLSGAYALAKVAGLDARCWGGRFYVYRDGVEIGSTLVTQNLAPPAEPELLRWAFDRLIGKETQA